MHEAQEGELITTADLAVRLRVSPETVTSWARRGRIPSYRFGHRTVRFDFPEVVKAIAARRQQRHHRARRSWITQLHRVVGREWVEVGVDIGKVFLPGVSTGLLEVRQRLLLADIGDTGHLVEAIEPQLHHAEGFISALHADGFVALFPGEASDASAAAVELLRRIRGASRCAARRQRRWGLFFLGTNTGARCNQYNGATEPHGRRRQPLSPNG